jgi:hypothetical protein
MLGEGSPEKYTLRNTKNTGAAVLQFARRVKRKFRIRPVLSRNPDTR